MAMRRSAIRLAFVVFFLFACRPLLAAQAPLHYEAAGQGPAVVLIHGGQCDRRIWDEQFERLSKRYRVVRYDIRGFGKSPKVVEPYSNVADLAGLLDKLKIERANLVGLSLGGAIATEFTIEHPDRVLSLTAAAPGLGGYEGWRPKTSERFRAITDAARDEPEKAVELWLADPMMQPAMENPQLAGRLRELATENVGCWLNNPLMQRPLQPPATKRLTEIKAPTLLLVGSRDIEEIREIVDLLEKQITGARKVIIDCAGHMINMERPQEFDAALEGFLSELNKEKKVSRATCPAEIKASVAADGDLRNSPTDPPWYQEFLQKRLHYDCPQTGEVQVRSDIVYNRAEGIELLCNIYCRNTSEPRPVVVFVHGGPIPDNLETNIKDAPLFDDYGRLAAASGFVGVTFAHRLHGYDQYLQAEQDVADLVAYVREHAAEFNGDRQQIFVWAFSGGGPLISQFLRDRPSYLRGVVAYYSLMELESPPGIPVTQELSDALDRLSPTRAISKGQSFPPVLIARAGLDDAGINRSIDHFVERALEHRMPLDLISHESGHHAFDVDDDNDRTREIVLQTIQFIRRKSQAPASGTEGSARAQ
jgi:3-oxoadipate enol-lactonase